MGLYGLSGVSPVVLVAMVVGGVWKHGGEGGKSLLTLMSLPCFVRIAIVPSTMSPSANGQPVFRRGLSFHITVTMGYGGGDSCSVVILCRCGWQQCATQ